MLSLRDTCFATTDAAARHKRFRRMELISQGRNLLRNAFISLAGMRMHYAFQWISVECSFVLNLLF